MENFHGAKTTQIYDQNVVAKLHLEIPKCCQSRSCVHRVSWTTYNLNQIGGIMRTANMSPFSTS